MLHTVGLGINVEYNLDLIVVSHEEAIITGRQQGWINVRVAFVSVGTGK